MLLPWDLMLLPWDLLLLPRDLLDALFSVLVAFGAAATAGSEGGGALPPEFLCDDEEFVEEAVLYPLSTAMLLPLPLPSYFSIVEYLDDVIGLEKFSLTIITIEVAMVSCHALSNHNHLTIMSIYKCITRSKINLDFRFSATRALLLKQINST